MQQAPDNHVSYNSLSMADLKAAIATIADHSVIGTHTQGLGCIETNFAYDRRPQIRIGAQKLYCSVLVALYKARQVLGEAYNIQPGYEASHFFCHNPHCIHAEHIFFEHPLDNKSRLYCRIYGHKDGFECHHWPECNICEQNKLDLY